MKTNHSNSEIGLEGRYLRPKRFSRVEIEETWVQRPDGVYWKWRLVGDKKWHYKATGYTKLPVVNILTKEAQDDQR